MAYLNEACDQISDSCHQQLLRKMRRKMCIYKCMLNVYKNQQNRQTGSRNLMGSKMLPTIWGTYMKLVTKYQISAINSCWEKYAHCSSHFSHQLLMTGIWYLVTSFIQVCHIVGSVFGPVRFLFPVCRLSWFLYTLNIYAHFSQQLLMTGIWYLVTSFI
jgi:hypothetical protein